jgi:hypothetical protein
MIADLNNLKKIDKDILNGSCVLGESPSVFVEKEERTSHHIRTKRHDEIMGKSGRSNHTVPGHQSSNWIWTDESKLWSC